MKTWFTFLLAVAVSGCLSGTDATTDESPSQEAPTQPSPPTVSYDCEQCWLPIGGVQSLAAYAMDIDPTDPNRVAVVGRSYAVAAGDEPSAGVDTVSTVAITHDAGQSWNLVATPEGIVPERYGMATGVAWDRQGRLHVAYAYDGTVVGGDIVLGSAEPTAYYARSDDFGSTWAVREVLQEGGDLPTLLAKDDRLVLTWNTGLPRTVQTSDLERQNITETTVPECWFPRGGSLHEEAYLPCIGSNSGNVRAAKWIAVGLDESKLIGRYPGCERGFATNATFVATCEDMLALSERRADSISTRSILEDLNHVAAAAEAHGHVHAVAYTNVGVDEIGSDHLETDLVHAVLSPNGQEIQRSVIDKRQLFYVSEATQVQQHGFMYPDIMDIENNRGYIIARDGMTNRSTMLSFHVSA